MQRSSSITIKRNITQVTRRLLSEPWRQAIVANNEGLDGFRCVCMHVFDVCAWVCVHTCVCDCVVAGTGSRSYCMSFRACMRSQFHTQICCDLHPPHPSQPPPPPTHTRAHPTLDHTTPLQATHTWTCVQAGLSAPAVCRGKGESVSCTERSVR